MADGAAKAPRLCAATISFDAASAIIAANALPLGRESVALARAGRRTLAEPVKARINSPRYDVAAMDGFAVRAEDVAERVQDYRIVGHSYPGEPWSGRLGVGEAVRIMTGSAVPDGAGQVLPFEIVTESGETISAGSVQPGRSHIRKRAADMREGAIVLPAGATLDARRMLVAAAADVAEVSVWRRPAVSVIATGDELVAPGGAAESATRIPDSLSESVLLMARQWGAKPLGSAMVRDDVAAIRAAAEAAIASCDVLVITAGASRGDRDFARAALAPLGLEILFSTVAMKPGKPVWYGRIGDCHVLGLPGNPTAALTVARLFMAPLLAGLGGRSVRSALGWRSLSLAAALSPSGDREAFLCALADADFVEVAERQTASAQLLLATANALARRAPHDPARAIGDKLDVLTF